MPSDEILAEVVRYLHRIADGEFPERVTRSAEIPDDLKPLVRTAALAGFQVEARVKRLQAALRATRVDLKRRAMELALRDDELSRRPVAEESALPDAIREAALRAGWSGRDVLVVGGGTGERLGVARAVHRAGARSRGPFLPFSASASSDATAETALFGVEHTRGAGETGAVERAANGTLFIDDAENLGPSSQSRLVRLIATRELLPVGARRARGCDVVVIVASPVDLRESRMFRHDLLRRLADVTVVAGPCSTREGSSAADPPSLGEKRRQAEARAIDEAIARTAGNRAAAARLLGISREGLRRKLKQFGQLAR